ncbi:MAG: NnrS family protein [Wenzhouxiangellaceae bacterium]|nr:NnrS family protein [Wenzhouxiangellaceae bacterium]
MSIFNIVFAAGFRVFFTSCALYAIAVMIAWIGVFTMGWDVAGSQPNNWHAHEMIHGVVAAAIAGFLLTAVPKWTATAPVNGPALAGLWLLWLAGRVGFWLTDTGTGNLSGQIAQAVDLAFLPGLAFAVGWPIVKSGNHRNLMIVVVLGVLFASNLMQGFDSLASRANILALDVVLLLMAIISGRIAPTFTRNWLSRKGLDPGAVQVHAWLDKLAVALIVLLALASLFGAPRALAGSIALAAALANLARLVEWQGWRAWRDPLVWVLHLGYAWIVIALLLRGIAGHSFALPWNAWVHALSVGAMATLILGVMARATLGHTGHELRLPTGGWSMFVLVTIAAVARTGSAIGWFGHGLALTLAGLAWIAAFAIFGLLFFPRLLRPRIDGLPG